MEKSFRISTIIYRVVLGLTLPFFLLLAGASGHQYRFGFDDILLICGTILPFLILSIYLKAKNNSNLLAKLLGFLLVPLLGFTLYKAIEAVIFLVNFNSDPSSIGFIGFCFLVLGAFIISNGVLLKGIIRELIKIQNYSQH